MKTIRQCFAVASILVGGIAVAIPDTLVSGGIPVSKMFMAVATALNAVNLYLIKEEKPTEETTATTATS